MKVTIIMNTHQFTLTSWGNGLAYQLLHKKSRMYIYVQDDDARMFWEEIDAMEDEYPTMPTDDILGYIWSNYDTVATQTEEL